MGDSTQPFPAYSRKEQETERSRRRCTQRSPSSVLLFCVLTIFVLGSHLHLTYYRPSISVRLPVNAEVVLSRCENLKLSPGPSPTFYNRTTSDRFVSATKPTLIKNATIWTGRIDGFEVIKGDLLLDRGLIKAIGRVSADALKNKENLVTIDAGGSWVSPGIVDLHSHLGVDAAPALSGANDGNSRHGIVQPWLRALDGLNTHDDAYHLSISGGVTTALVLPGSANGIGGQAFVIKLRDTEERSPTSKLLEPPFTINHSSTIDWSLPPRWRQMKHACGENPRRVYGNTRMDNIWAMRQVYDTARQIKEKQDTYCEKVFQDEWTGLGEFPEELQWEALVDVLRGRVKVQVHCYEEVDLDDIVRLTNEFKFPIAAFHHAHETYLVPDLLKKAYGNVPASAIFATNARYKREAYRGSEFAARILADNGLQVVMKSDHPVLNSRYLLYEAQQAYYYGLPENIALASVTSTPAKVMGMDHRVGLIQEGFDADVVIWDSHPLALGATPQQVFIDGIAQLPSPHVNKKPANFQNAPKTPNFDREATDAVKYEGLPPLEPEKSIGGMVIFINVKSLTIRSKVDETGLAQTFTTQDGNEENLGVVVIEHGEILCAGTEISCSQFLATWSKAEIVDLQGGAISPSLVSYGSSLGLEEIENEVSTTDGVVYDALTSPIPSILGGDSSLIRAADGLIFATRNAYLGYRSGVTLGVSAPRNRGFIAGLGTAFGLGSPHKLAPGALVQEVTAVHVSIRHYGATPSVSSQFTTLRRLLLEPGEGEVGRWFDKVARGDATLVVEAQSADVITTLLHLKKEIEKVKGHSIKLTITGATEAHLIADKLAESDVGVILVPSRPFPESWSSRRILPGPPLTKDSGISLLIANNVTVGIGIEEAWSTRNIRFDIAWAALEVYEGMSHTEALAMASTNLEKLLGLQVDATSGDLVATKGGHLLEFESKVVGVLSAKKGVVDLF